MGKNEDNIYSKGSVDILKTCTGGRSPLSKEGDMFDGVEREIGAWTTKGLLIKVKQNIWWGKILFKHKKYFSPKLGINSFYEHLA